jgi:hypothetical protein
VPPKNPLDKIKHAASETIKDPIGTARRSAGQALGQARGTVEIGRTIAGQVTKSAAGVIATRVPGHKAPAPGPVGEPDLRAVPAETTPAEKAPAKKTPAKKAPAKKGPAKAVRPPVTDVATPVVKQQAAHQAPPKAAPAPESPIDAAADPEQVDATPADLARKATAVKSPARKPAAKAPAKKTAAKEASTPSAKLPAKKVTGRKPPKTAAELIEDADLPSPIESIGNPPTQD